MAWHTAWAKKQAGNPTLLLVAALGFSFSLFGFYRYAYNPWAKAKKMREAKEYADFIYAKENEEK